MTINQNFKTLSVIIPVWNEPETIISTLQSVMNSKDACDCTDLEVFVVDGHPDSGTLLAIERSSEFLTLQQKLDLQLVSSKAGRAVQMNYGAAQSSGKYLLFLHADTLLPTSAIENIIQAFELKDVSGGAFDFAFDSDEPFMKTIAYFGRLRSRFERVPYGDQGHFIRREVFNSLGGYAEIPIMEDVQLMKRLRKGGLHIVICPQRVITSARRYSGEGRLKRMVKNWCMRLAYGLGVSPETLSGYYKKW